MAASDGEAETAAEAISFSEGSEGRGELVAARGDDRGMPTWLMELAWPGIFQAWALLTIV